MNNEKQIINDIEQNLKLLKKESLKIGPKDLEKKWDFLVTEEPKKFINQDLTLKIDVLRNFRKLRLFIPDEPAFDASVLNMRSHISGHRRGIKRLLSYSLDVIKKYGYTSLLTKYPVNEIGNPNVFKSEGYTYTYRWLKHIYSLGLINNILENKIQDGFVTLDIGSSYGVFDYLFKKEYPNCCSVLLDFPEQLVLAHYYLGMSFPEAKIAGYKEILGEDKLDRAFFNNYDFVLVPLSLYNRIAPKSIDLVVNFASFGEMRREWFDYYVKAEPFLSAKYFFTENRFQSAPTYDTDITILDYPLLDFKKLHFGICPIFSHVYKRKLLFFYERLYFTSQYFEFIGERKQVC